MTRYRFETMEEVFRLLGACPEESQASMLAEIVARCARPKDDSRSFRCASLLFDEQVARLERIGVHPRLLEAVRDWRPTVIRTAIEGFRAYVPGGPKPRLPFCPVIPAACATFTELMAWLSFGGLPARIELEDDHELVPGNEGGSEPYFIFDVAPLALPVPVPGPGDFAGQGVAGLTAAETIAVLTHQALSPPQLGRAISFAVPGSVVRLEGVPDRQVEILLYGGNYRLRALMDYAGDDRFQPVYFCRAKELLRAKDLI